MGGKGKGKGKGKSKGSDGKGKGRGKADAKPVGFASDIPGYRWVPKSFRKKSLFATQSFEEHGDLSMFPGAARVCELRTCSEMLGVLECIIVEPSSKQLVPQAFLTTGVIICLHGMPPSPSILEEWGGAVEAAGWTDLSCTVVIPNVQMSAALQLRDFEAIVDAALELANFSRCLIVGKAWGALRAVEIATLAALGGKVEGVILVAPSSPAPQVCEELAVPALLLWAVDDEVSSFNESDLWKEALDDRCAPTSFVKCSSGGHRLDKMLDDHLSAQAVRNFTTAALLVGELEEDAGALMTAQRSNRDRRLTEELPRFLQDDEESEDDELAEEPKAVNQAEKRSSRTLDIMNWMQAGMTTATE